MAATYLAPAAVWKSSYRLILGEDEPMLEGWAIVDNTSGDDWLGVSLSLVSGLPVSFINSLYSPKYVSRPRIQLKQDRAWKPVIHGAAIETLPEPPTAIALGGLGGPGTIQGIVTDASGAVIPGAEVSVSGRDGTVSTTTGGDGSFHLSGLAAGKYTVTISSEGFNTHETRAKVGDQPAFVDAVLEVGQVTETITVGRAPRRRAPALSTVAAPEDGFVGADLGDLFEYAIQDVVTVRQGESAMLPFFSGSAKARRLLVYSESYGSQHPLNAVELLNDSGQSLDGGAITVYADGGYAGEALMETLKPNDKRLVSYAVDLGVRIKSDVDVDEEELPRIHATQGVLTSFTRVVRRKTFTIRNVDQREKTLWVEHVPQRGYVPTGIRPIEETEELLRYETELAPESEQKFVIEEETTDAHNINLSGLSIDQMIRYSMNEDWDPAGRAQLAKLVAAMREIESKADELADVTERLFELRADQLRLRENIATFDAVAGQSDRVQAFADRLADSEDRLTQLQNEEKELKAEKAIMEAKLESDIQTLSF